MGVKSAFFVLEWRLSWREGAVSVSEDVMGEEGAFSC